MRIHSHFTDYVRSIVDAGGDYRSVEIPDEIFQEINYDLKRLLNHHGLTPFMLDCSGEKWDAETLLEMTSICFLAVFIGNDSSTTQLEHLVGMVSCGNSIEGAVRNKINWFVQDLHRKKFPRSYGIRSNLVATVQLIEDENREDLRRISRNRKVSDECLIGPRGAAKTEAIQETAIQDFVVGSSTWQDALEIVHRTSKEALQRSKAGIEEMGSQGAVPFLFGGLKSIIISNCSEKQGKNTGDDVESELLDEFSQSDRNFDNPDRYESAEAREELVSQVRAGIEGIYSGKKGAAALRKRLHLFYDSVLELRGELAPGDKLKQVALGEKLDMATSTVSDLMKKIKAIEAPIIQKYVAENC